MAEQAPAIGQLLGHYRIVERVGAGGMGVVYRAHDTHLERDVAIKVLPPGTLTDDDARKRFRREALMLSRLNHPNLATVHDFDTDNGVDFLVMEFIPGDTLETRIAAGPLDEAEVVRIGEQVATGLAAAHDRGVIHRDLKPGNLLLTTDGTLKILDFGLAKLLAPVAGGMTTTETLTQHHGVAGTLPYMAPEQLLGEAVDQRSDIYAAGAVLYESCTGRRAFPELAPTRLTDCILHRNPKLPRSLNSKVSPGLERIILKCLEKRADKRYQSARDLDVDLRHLQTSVAGTQPTTLTLRPTYPRVRRRTRFYIWTACGSALIILAILSFSRNWSFFYRGAVLPANTTPELQKPEATPARTGTHSALNTEAAGAQPHPPLTIGSARARKELHLPSSSQAASEGTEKVPAKEDSIKVNSAQDLPSSSQAAPEGTEKVPAKEDSIKLTGAQAFLKPYGSSTVSVVDLYVTNTGSYPGNIVKLKVNVKHVFKYNYDPCFNCGRVGAKGIYNVSFKNVLDGIDEYVISHVVDPGTIERINLLLGGDHSDKSSYLARLTITIYTGSGKTLETDPIDVLVQNFDSGTLVPIDKVTDKQLKEFVDSGRPAEIVTPAAIKRYAKRLSLPGWYMK